ncbi:MAG: tRNA (5-methylaminomethyl-2-thiouridine)(34)-methyltransferase MnmD [Saprospiraceae bacterium]|nr:tRNA (5-methylaminomethyl-2-thiouridine)(34)-methyltransferase MnmD [Saprospiraceae bacterium]
MVSLITTADGSHSLYSESAKNYYHSIHGALSESKHVFIDHGLKPIAAGREHISIFEMGFGTGLNAFLSYAFADNHSPLSLKYSAIDNKPLPESVYKTLNYPEFLEIASGASVLLSLHTCPWDLEVQVSEFFSLKKILSDFNTWEPDAHFDLIYMDAFSPNDQPELWESKSLEKFFHMLEPGGLLCTYCAKGIFKRRLREIGFKVVCYPGPFRKREMTCAYK